MLDEKRLAPSHIGGPKPLKTLLEFQVKRQEVVMQQNNSSPCGHQTRSQRNPLTKTVALLATPHFQCGAGICALQVKKKVCRKTGSGKHRERGFLYHQRITFSGSLVRSPMELKAFCNAFHFPETSRWQAIVAPDFAGGEC